MSQIFSSLQQFWQFTGFCNMTFQHLVMIVIGIVFITLAIKAELNDGKAPLDGSAVTDARVSYDGTGMNKGNPSVSMSMNAEGANTWARLTRDNIGKQIAIVLDGLVYSYPNVQNEISGGHSSITASACDKSIRPFKNARFVNSPGSAGRAPCLITVSRTFFMTVTPPWQLISTTSSLVYV